MKTLEKLGASSLSRFEKNSLTDLSKIKGGKPGDKTEKGTIMVGNRKFAYTSDLETETSFKYYGLSAADARSTD